MLQLESNPKSVFVCSEEQILKMLNQEFDVAWAAVNLNNWDSILVHCIVFSFQSKSRIAHSH
jgi:hypothetical protein